MNEWLERLPAVAIGLALVALALAAYWLPGTDRIYNHFVWQALAFLHGRAAIDWPVPGGPGIGNEWMQDVFPLRDAAGNLTGGALLPFPPLPAIVMLPAVAIWGIQTDVRAVSVVGGAIAVGLCWWALGGLALSRRVRIAATVFFGGGTCFWYAAQLGTTWFFAHVVAVTFAFLAIGVALRADPGAADDLRTGRRAQRPSGLGIVGGAIADLRRPLALIDGRQLLAGLLFGLACTARLTVVFGAPFFMLVGGGGSWLRRSVSAGIGALIPVGLLLLYNVATTGHLFHPGYEYQYQLEANGYPGLHYNPAWGIEDLRYLGQNIRIMFLQSPVLFPDRVPSAVSIGRELCTSPNAARGLFDPSCPLALPDDVGTSILLTSPAYLLVLPAVLRGRSRLVAGTVLAIGAIAFVNLMHFSQGWVQFGYRFSNDFVPFATVLLAIAMARRGGIGMLGFWLIGASLAINLWGVIWGNILGW